MASMEPTQKNKKAKEEKKSSGRWGHVSAIMQINLCQPLSTIAAHMITSNACFTHSSYSYLSEPRKRKEKKEMRC